MILAENRPSGSLERAESLLEVSFTLLKKQKLDDDLKMWQALFVKSTSQFYDHDSYDSLGTHKVLRKLYVEEKDLLRSLSMRGYDA